MRIWTFIKDGPRWCPCGIDTSEYRGPYSIGNGYSGFLIAAPNGRTFIAEANTGAFLGGSFDEVRKDVAADSGYIERQVRAAREKLAQVQLIDEDLFWRSLKCE